MAAVPVDATLQMSIQQRIEEAYTDRRIALFVPEQFVSVGLGDRTSIVVVLRTLTSNHFLAENAEVKCAFGHRYWGGDLLKLEQEHALKRPCPIASCGSHKLTPEEAEDEENQPRVFIRYSMTSPWKEKLDASKKA